MKVKVSDKNQVVIPKAIRKQLGIKPGQMLEVEAGKNRTVVIKHDVAADVDAVIEKYAGIGRGAWGADPAATLRKMRDKEWN